jgi:glycosyltransferase involved in cell wall biosynthesis
LNIKNNAHFIGFVTTEELQNLYSSATAYIMPALNEDFGLCPAEALSCGTPVITWRDGSGPAEQVINTFNGYHAEPYNTLDMANKINLCIESRFKQTHRQDILDSAKRFSEEGQRSIFITAINNILQNQKI